MSDTTQTTTDEPTWFTTLEATPAEMASRVIAWMPETTLAGYQCFLNMMYHYTLGSEARLRQAAEMSRYEVLRGFYEELAEEEAPHYELARRDLATFGLTPAPETPDAVRRFQAVWDSASARDELVWLGALFSLESVGSYLGAAAHTTLGALGLAPHQATFVLVHLEADEEHGALCQRYAREVGQHDPDALLRGAREAGEAWVEMHRCIRAQP